MKNEMKYREPKPKEIYLFKHGNSVHFTEVLSVVEGTVTVEWNLFGYGKPRWWKCKYRFSTDIEDFYERLL